MKRKFYLSVLFISLIVVMTGCKTASRLYETGDYDEAVELAVKKLQKKNDDESLKSVLQNAYRFAVDQHESKIRTHLLNNNELKWEWVYNEYSLLQKLYNAIRRSPEATDLVNTTDYSSYLTTYAEKAADIRYERGMRWMVRNDKQSFRNAFAEFNQALFFKPGDYDIKSKLDEAYQNAVVNVIVMPLDNYGYRYVSNNDFELRNFENDILRKLKYHSNNKFVNFYSDGDIHRSGIRPDQFIDFRFNTMNIGRVREEISKRVVSKEVVVKETVYKPDSVVKEYKKIYATIQTTKRILNSAATMLVNIRDDQGRRLWSNDFRGGHSWVTEFATYTGDERALSESDKELLNRNRAYPPREEEIIRHIISDIQENLYHRLRDYYNRY